MTARTIQEMTRVSIHNFDEERRGWIIEALSQNGLSPFSYGLDEDLDADRLDKMTGDEQRQLCEEIVAANGAPCEVTFMDVELSRLRRWPNDFQT